MKRCPKCKEIKTIADFTSDSTQHDKLNVYCRRCSSFKDKKYREKNKELLKEKRRQRYGYKPKRKGLDPLKRNLSIKAYRQRNKDKLNARARLAYAVKIGKIEKPDKCSICESKTKIEAHHPDYKKPLEIIWVCFQCHREKYHERMVIC